MLVVLADNAGSWQGIPPDAVSAGDIVAAFRQAIGSAPHFGAVDITQAIGEPAHGLFPSQFDSKAVAELVADRRRILVVQVCRQAIGVEI